MKKLLVLALVCLAAAIRVNGENRISIGDVFIQNGGKTIITVKYECEKANSVNTCGFTLSVPEGITVPGDYVLDNSNKGFTQVSFDAASKSFAFVAGSDGLTLSGSSGTLAYITLNAASTATGELTVNVTNVSYTVDEVSSVDLPNTSFKVTVEDRVILDENSTAPVEEDYEIDVRVIRSINANTWSTICLPFDMSESQVKTAFGSDVKLAEFNGAEIKTDPADDKKVVEIIMNFKPVEKITVHRPCIIKVSSAITDFTVDEVDTEYKGEPSYDDGAGNSFIGTYVANTQIPKNRIFISGGQFWYSDTDGKTYTKAFRGFFKTKKPLTNQSAARIGLNVDGEVTYINSLDAEMNDGEYYDLQGRRVNNPHKGLYIQNGKKVFVK